MNKNQNHDDQVCIIVNNEILCVSSDEKRKYEKKRFEKKLNRAAKVREKDYHLEPNEICNILNSEYVAPH